VIRINKSSLEKKKDGEEKRRGGKTRSKQVYQRRKEGKSHPDPLVDPA